MLTLDKAVAEEVVTDLDGDGKLDPGDTIRYTISYSNTGQITATGVILIDDYDQTLIEVVANIAGEGEDNGSTITWHLGTLRARNGDSVSYEATLKDTFPPGCVSMQNAATIDSAETDPQSTTTLVSVGGPDLTIRKGRAETIVQDVGSVGVIDAGDTIKYIINYENIGNVDATNVIIVDDYPEAHIADVANISYEGVNDGKTIVWALGKVEAGKGGQVTYEARLRHNFAHGTDVKNTVTISSDRTEPETVHASVRVEAAPTATTTPMPTSTPTPMPTPTQTPTPQPTVSRETTRENVLVVVPHLDKYIIGLGSLCLVVLLFTALTRRIETSDGRLEVIRMVQEGICVTLIAVAVVILRLTACITEEGAVSILSGIIGYVLGRASAR